MEVFRLEKTNITVCANDGLSTAGGGGIWENQRYFNFLKKCIVQLKINIGGREVKTVNRGHGA